jgi:ArsR family transcriptional regulator
MAMEIEKVKYYTDNQEKVACFAKELAQPVRVLDYLANNTDKCCYSGDMAEDLLIARTTLS